MPKTALLRALLGGGHVEIYVCLLSFDPSNDPNYQTVLSSIPSRLSSMKICFTHLQLMYQV
jgi:hypothetical protein